jgi:hypothetical protein
MRAYACKAIVNVSIGQRSGEGGSWQQWQRSKAEGLVAETGPLVVVLGPLQDTMPWMQDASALRFWRSTYQDCGWNVHSGEGGPATYIYSYGREYSGLHGLWCYLSALNCLGMHV